MSGLPSCLLCVAASHRAPHSPHFPLFQLRVSLTGDTCTTFLDRITLYNIQTGPQTIRLHGLESLLVRVSRCLSPPCCPLRHPALRLCPARHGILASMFKMDAYCVKVWQWRVWFSPLCMVMGQWSICCKRSDPSRSSLSKLLLPFLRRSVRNVVPSTPSTTRLSADLRCTVHLPPTHLFASYRPALVRRCHSPYHTFRTHFPALP